MACARVVREGIHAEGGLLQLRRHHLRGAHAQGALCRSNPRAVWRLVHYSRSPFHVLAAGYSQGQVIRAVMNNERPFVDPELKKAIPDERLLALMESLWAPDPQARPEMIGALSPL